MARGEVLIVHHVEPLWEQCIPEELVWQLRTHLYRAEYSRVIYATLEGDIPLRTARQSRDLAKELAFIALADALRGTQRLECQEWGYAFEPPDHGGSIDPANLIPVSSAHEWAYAYPWLRDLARYSGRVVICGGGRDECLRDLQETLDWLGIRYRTIHRLTY
jgi:hypothetical protein